MDPTKTMIVVTILISVFTLLLGVIGWLIKLTISDLKTAVEKLSLSVSGMNAVMASQQTEMDSFKGICKIQYGQLNKKVDQNEKKLGEHDKDIAVLKQKVS